MSAKEGWIAQAKEHRIAYVASELQLDVRRGRIACPACEGSRQDPKRGTVSTFAHGLKWRCHACKQSGSSIDLVGIALGVEPVSDETRAWFAVRGWCDPPAGHGDPPRVKPGPPPPVDAPKTYPSRGDVERLWSTAGRLTSDESSTAWVRSRGLDPDILEDQDLVRVLPSSPPEWARRWRKTYRVVLPLYDATGAIRSVRARKVFEDVRGRKSLNPKGFTVRGLVFANGAGVALLKGGELAPEATVYIVEGGPDFLTMSSWLSDHAGDVVFGIGNGQWSEAFAAKLPEGTQVVILTDRNPDGFRYAEQIARSLEGRCPCHKPDPTHADLRDLNDRWRQDGDEAFDPLAGLVDHDPGPPPGGQDGSSSAGTGPPERPEVVLGLDIAQSTFDAIAAISKHPEVFVRGTQLVTLRDDTILPLTESMVRVYLSLSATFVKFKKGPNGDWLKVPDKPSLALAKQVREWSRYPDARRVEGVTSTPAIRPDGSVATTPGYDAATRLIYRPEGAPPTMSPEPTHRDACEAVERLLDVVDEVPFQAPSDRSSWLALLLTLVGRNLIQGNVPLFAAIANQARTGKTRLVQYAELIALGTSTGPSRWPTGRDEEELGKRVDAAILDGRSLLFLDNVRGRIESLCLEAAVTSPTYTPRILGKSKVPTVPQRTVFAISANAPRFGGDLAHRTLPIRLFWAGPDPKSRTFRRPDLHAFVEAHRDELHAAALTILSAYLRAGSPDLGLPTWGSYEAWSRLVRNALVWAGQPDPLASRADIEDQDTEEAAHERLLQFVSDTMNQREFTAGQLAGLLSTEPGNGWTRDDARDLAAEINVWDSRSKDVNRRSLGLHVKSRLDRPGRSGLRITRALGKTGPRSHRTGVPYYVLASNQGEADGPGQVTSTR